MPFGYRSGHPEHRRGGRARAVFGVTFVAALVAFAVVQDRVTATGAREYVARQRAALAGGVAPVTIDEVMRPAKRRSLRDALAWSGGVMLIGILGSRFLLPGSGNSRE